MMRFLAVLVLTAQMLVLTWGAVSADEFKLTPSIAVRQAYDDNIFFDSSHQKESPITTVTPGLELSNRTERLDLNLRAHLAPFFYWDESDLNDVDQSYSGRIEYRLTPRLSLNAAGSFRVDNRPDRDITATGLTFGADRSYRHEYGGGLSYALTEITGLTLSYTYDREDWATDDPDREDFYGHTASAGLTHNLDRWLRATTGSLTVGGGYYHYDSSETKTGFGYAGLSHRLSELFTLRGTLGGRYTESEFDTVQLVFVPPVFLVPETVRQTRSRWGALGDLGLDYRGEKLHAAIAASHDLRTGIGSTGPSYLTRFTTELGYRLLEKLVIGVSAGYYLNRADGDEFARGEIDQDTVYVRPHIRWEFFKDFTLEGAYSFTLLTDDVADARAVRNVVYLQLAWGLPLFE